ADQHPRARWGGGRDGTAGPARWLGRGTGTGRRLPGLFRLEGLTEIGIEATADIYPPGHPRCAVRIDLVRSMRPRILERGLAGDRELEELARAARGPPDDPAPLVLPHLLFLAWGRRPLA